eukprot:TRINITY_DN78_c0_g1_i1.p1 TRINITY_DN78_c0_g1~~TRINITY_DN78_c0_g1_i1.p1  ORF type:complete len:330 (-),score=65.05 TRINITY_DN78_c0_g1_i1:413-1402(-)
MKAAPTQVNDMAFVVPPTQKAWTYKQYGPVQQNLRLEDNVEVQGPAPDQVLVKVKAASLNPIDFLRYGGKFEAIDSELPHVPGYDVAGLVVKLGSDAKGFKVGDEVYADVNESSIFKPKRFGTLAQYVAVEERLVALKPRNLSFLEAAGIPVAFLTAQQALDTVSFKPGQSVLVVGGAGGVGSAAIQLAKHVYGAALVAATASTKKLDFIKSLGADDAIDYTQTNYWELSQKYDLVFDTIGESAKGTKVVAEGGAGVAVSEFDNLPPNFQAISLVPSGANLLRLNPDLETGKVKPVQDGNSPYKFGDVVEAYTYLEKGRALGKVIIQVE